MPRRPEQLMPEQDIETPELKEKTTAPIEIETKIFRLGSKKKFVRKVVDNGGTETHPSRLIQDTRFSLLHSNHEKSNIRRLRNYMLEGFPNSAEFISILKFLGMENVNSNDQGMIVFRRPLELEEKAVRIRRDVDRIILSAKTLRIKGSDVDEREEHEASIPDKESTINAIINLLSGCGYEFTSYREKMRTTFEIPLGKKSTHRMIKIDLDESPLAGVDPWAEVEGPSREDVLEIVNKLGYSKKDYAGMSTSEYYAIYGKRKRDLKNLVFENQG